MYFVFDIGGTNMRMAVSAHGKSIQASKIIPTASEFEQGIRILKQTALELSGGEKIIGVAGGIAGTLNQGKSMLVSSPHIKGWIMKPFKSELEKIFGCEVILENDACLAGLGEAIKGSGAGKKIVAYITIGTGVGGARIVEGNIDKNTLGFEPGHQVIIPDGNLCNCGGNGHLETYVGGFYIERDYGQKAQDLKDEKVWDKIAKYLSIGLNNVIVHWSPDIVVLGGSVMNSISLDKIITHLNEQLKIFPKAPQIVKASLGDNADLFGALHLLTNC